MNYFFEKNKEELKILSGKINPVIKKDGYLYYIEPVDLQRMSFLWSPVFTEKALNIKVFCRIITYHSFSFHGFFKPTISEVLSQIPDEHIKNTVAFETIGPHDTSDLNNHKEAINDNYHVAITNLYKEEE